MAYSPQSFPSGLSLGLLPGRGFPAGQLRVQVHTRKRSNYALHKMLRCSTSGIAVHKLLDTKQEGNRKNKKHHHQQTTASTSSVCSEEHELQSPGDSSDDSLHQSLDESLDESPADSSDHSLEDPSADSSDTSLEDSSGWHGLAATSGCKQDDSSELVTEVGFFESRGAAPHSKCAAGAPPIPAPGGKAPKAAKQDLRRGANNSGARRDTKRRIQKHWLLRLQKLQEDPGSGGLHWGDYGRHEPPQEDYGRSELQEDYGRDGLPEAHLPNERDLGTDSGSPRGHLSPNTSEDHLIATPSGLEPTEGALNVEPREGVAKLLPKRVKVALHLFNELVTEYPEYVNARHVCAAVQACVKEGALECAEEIIQRAKEMGGAASPNCHVYTALAHGYCQAGQRNAAHALLQRLLQEGSEVDAAMFNVLLAEEQSVEGTTQLMQAMKDNGIPPNERTFSAAIRSAGRAGDAKSAADLWESMRLLGIHPSPYTYSCLADAYARCGLPKKCAAVAREMKLRLGNAGSTMGQSLTHRTGQNMMDKELLKGAGRIMREGGLHQGAMPGNRRVAVQSDSRLVSSTIWRRTGTYIPPDRTGTPGTYSTPGTPGKNSTSGTPGPYSTSCTAGTYRAPGSGAGCSQRSGVLSITRMEGYKNVDTQEDVPKPLHRNLVSDAPPSSARRETVFTEQKGVPSYVKEQLVQSREEKSSLPEWSVKEQVVHSAKEKSSLHEWSVKSSSNEWSVKGSPDEWSVIRQSVLNSLVRAYAEGKDSTGALRTLQRMRTEGVPLSIRSFNAAARALIRAGKAREAITLLHQALQGQGYASSGMRGQGDASSGVQGHSTPVGYTSGSPLDCVTILGSNTLGIVQEGQKSVPSQQLRSTRMQPSDVPEMQSGEDTEGVLRVHPNGNTFALLVQAAGHLRDSAEVEDALARMAHHGHTPDAVIFRSAVFAYVRCGDGASAMAMLQAMMEKGHPPAMPVAQILVKSMEAALFIQCSYAAKKGRLREVLLDMKAAGLAPSPNTAAYILRKTLESITTPRKQSLESTDLENKTLENGSLESQSLGSTSLEGKKIKSMSTPSDKMSSADLPMSRATEEHEFLETDMCRETLEAVLSHSNQEQGIHSQTPVSHTTQEQEFLQSPEDVLSQSNQKQGIHSQAPEAVLSQAMDLMAQFLSGGVSPFSAHTLGPLSSAFATAIQKTDPSSAAHVASAVREMLTSADAPSRVSSSSSSSSPDGAASTRLSEDSVVASFIRSVEAAAKLHTRGDPTATQQHLTQPLTWAKTKKKNEKQGELEKKAKQAEAEEKEKQEEVGKKEKRGKGEKKEKQEEAAVPLQERVLPLGNEGVGKQGQNPLTLAQMREKNSNDKINIAHMREERVVASPQETSGVAPGTRVKLQGTALQSQGTALQPQGTTLQSRGGITASAVQTSSTQSPTSHTAAQITASAGPDAGIAGDTVTSVARDPESVAVVASSQGVVLPSASGDPDSVAEIAGSSVVSAAGDSRSMAVVSGSAVVSAAGDPGSMLLETMDALLRRAIAEEVAGNQSTWMQLSDLETSPDAAGAASAEPNTTTQDENGVPIDSKGKVKVEATRRQTRQAEVMNEFAAAGLRLTSEAVDDIINRVVVMEAGAVDPTDSRTKVQLSQTFILTPSSIDPNDSTNTVPTRLIRPQRRPPVVDGTPEASETGSASANHNLGEEADRVLSMEAGAMALGGGSSAWLQRAIHLVCDIPAIAKPSAFVFGALIHECWKRKEWPLAEHLWRTMKERAVEPNKDVWLARMRCLSATGQIGGRVRYIVQEVADSNRTARLEIDADILRLLLKAAVAANDQDGAMYIRSMLRTVDRISS